MVVQKLCLRVSSKILRRMLLFITIVVMGNHDGAGLSDIAVSNEQCNNCEGDSVVAVSLCMESVI